MKQTYKSLLILVLLISSIFANKQYINNRQTQEAFKNLKESSLGKDIYTSILLELETFKDNTDGKNVVDKILEMLQELRVQYTQSQQDSQSELGDKNKFCGERLSALQADIQDIQQKILKATDLLPGIEDQVNQKSADVEEQQKEIDSSTSAIALVHEKNQAAVQAYDDSVQEHDDMTAALEKAKELISSLLTSGFLQRNVHSVLVQLKNHKQTTVQQLPNHQKKGIFGVLVGLAQDIGTQADQTQVSDIIAIIDELIQSEREMATVEFEAEQKRLERFQFDLTRASAAAEQLEATIKDLEADAKTLQLRATELQQDIAQWEASVKSKQEQHDLQKKSCDDSTVSLESNLQMNEEILAIIEQVIEIFESKDIQDIKKVVSDIKVE